MDPRQQPGQSIMPQSTPQHQPHPPIPMPSTPAVLNTRPDIAAEQYKFITDNGDAKKPPINLKTTSKIQRIIIVAVLSLLLIIGLIIGNSFLSSSKNKSRDALIGLNKQQTKILYITSTNQQRPQDRSTLALGVTVSSVLLTDQTLINSKAAKAGFKINAKQFQLSPSEQATIKSLFDQAARNNQYDSTFSKEVRQQLREYMDDLKATYESTSNKALKEALNNGYLHAEALTKASP